MSQSQGDSDDKQFDATPQRRQKARDDGDVAQSKEANGFALVVAIIICAYLFKAWVGNSVFTALSILLSRVDQFSQDAFASTGSELRGWLISFLVAVAPIFLFAFVFVLGALVIQRAIVVSLKRIKPDINKLSPMSNLKKRYGASGLTDFLKDTAKMLFFGAIAGVFLYRLAENSYAASSVQRGGIGSFLFDSLLEILVALCAFQAVLAVIDLPLQHHLLSQKLKMSREDMKQESKQSEGDGQLKQKRRQMAKSISQSAMLTNTRQATVVVVNPTHYAVALRWEEGSQSAPVCVAKGVDHLAAAIRKVALANGVPIYSDPPCARSIYATVEIDQEILPTHFAAVAAAIQFVQGLKSVD